MIKLNLSKNYLYLTIAFLLAFILFRLFMAGGNFSYFSVFGKNYTNANLTPFNAYVIEGDGYDGQFFTRYAINPFAFEKTAYGITVDEPLYRNQRVFYPMVVWLLSMGNAKAIPFTMVLVNALAFLFLIIGFKKIIVHYHANPNLILLPFFVFGLYMSLARNLSEIVELCLFTWLFFSVIKRKLAITIALATCAIFTRETSIISVGPILLGSAIYHLNNKKYLQVLIHGLPIVLYALWRLYLQQTITASSAAVGYQHIGLPFVGMWQGLMANINFTTNTLVMASAFFVAYWVWQIWLVIITIQALIKTSSTLETKALALAFLLWLILAIVFNFTVWADDWGFVRVFAIWNLGSMLLLATKNRTPNKMFFIFSILLLSLTFARVIIRI
jgi:hypothetical protein